MAATRIQRAFRIKNFKRKLLSGLKVFIKENWEQVQNMKKLNSILEELKFETNSYFFAYLGRKTVVSTVHCYQSRTLLLFRSGSGATLLGFFLPRS